jgi:hypothetical protein
MGPGSVSAFTRVFDALWAGTTETADSVTLSFAGSCFFL